MESEQNTNAHEINNLTSNQHYGTHRCDMLWQFKMALQLQLRPNEYKIIVILGSWRGVGEGACVYVNLHGQREISFERP